MSRLSFHQPISFFTALLALIALTLAIPISPVVAQDRPLIGSFGQTGGVHPPSTPKLRSSQTFSNYDAAYHDRFIPLQLFDDFKFLAGQPDFYAVMGGLGLAPSVFKSSFDHESPEFTEMWGHSQFADNMFEAGEFVGQAAYPIAASAAFWSFGKLKHHRGLQAFGTDLFRAQAMSGAFTLALKVSINRKRPNGGSYGYPSGHTSSAFATAGVVYKHLGLKWGIPAFALATYVGFSRLQENKHYFSDVVAGGILGSYVGLKLGGRRFADHDVTIAPVLSGGNRGISLSAHF